MGTFQHNVLVTGPPGSGKSLLYRSLTAQGFRAYDADHVPRLCSWYDSDGNKVDHPPESLSEDFLNRHSYLWDLDHLRSMLRADRPLFLCGISGNVLDAIQLFDRCYYLHLEAELLVQRIINDTRADRFGKTDIELPRVLAHQKYLDVAARERQLHILNANLSSWDVVRQLFSSFSSRLTA